MNCVDGLQVDVEGLMKVDEVMTNDKKGEADGVASPLEEVKVVVGRWTTLGKPVDTLEGFENKDCS